MKLNAIRRLGLTAMCAGASALFAAVPAAPGVVNFIEGQATLDGQALSGKSVGSAQLQKGDVLQTDDGRAEILLSPGVFLRVAQNSAVRMVSSGLLDTRVALERGSALVEADQLHKESNIRVLDNGSQTTLLKKGLYRFNADAPSVAVYDGKAQVIANDKSVDLKSGHELNLNGPVATQKFDKTGTENSDSLYAWSKLRSEYLSEASAATARTYVIGNSGWIGSGWYWNPFWRTYAWMPGDPVFYSPFGFGYYSPFAFTGGYLGGYYGPTYYRVRPAVRTAGPQVGARIIQPRAPITTMRAPVGAMHAPMGRVGRR